MSTDFQPDDVPHQEEKIERTCANCACSILQKNAQLGNIEHMFCRKDPINAGKARFERPQMVNGEVRIDKRTQKPIMETYEDLAFMYRPVIKSATCFDGWRPIGTEPGDKFQNAPLDKMMAPLMETFGRLYKDMTRDAFVLHELDPLCPHGKIVGSSCADCPNGEAEVASFSNLYDIDGDPKTN
jgi:hypothetical protein